MRPGVLAVGFAGCALLIVGCADDPPPATQGTISIDAVQRFPNVLDATASESADGIWRFDVTILSPYDTPERYADAWRVTGDDGVVYGVRELTHDHQAEQPFTRSLSGVEIPADVTTVTIEGRDQENGWGGATAEVALR